MNERYLKIFEMLSSENNDDVDLASNILEQDYLSFEELRLLQEDLFNKFKEDTNKWSRINRIINTAMLTAVNGKNIIIPLNE